MNNFARATLFLSILLCASCSVVKPSVVATSTSEKSREALAIANYLGDGGVSDFYRVTAQDLPSQAGLLISQEPMDVHQSVPSASTSVRILYTSTNGLDDKTIVPVSGSLFVPQGRAPEDGWPVVLWSHGTVGIADVCAPSWTGYVDFHDQYLKQWLDQGYAILASDYQGLGTKGSHPYLATKPAAYNNLDLMRAANSLGYPLSKKTVVVGQSQGAGAAIATAAYANDYAPELSLLGVVATGVPFFSPEGIVAVQQSRPKDRVDPMLGYNFLALTLVEQLLPDFRLEDYVYDSVVPTARAVSGVCNRDMRKRITQEGLTYNQVFKQSPEEPLKIAFAQMGFPTLEISIPIYVGAGSADRDTPLRMQSSFVNKACAAGTVIQAHVYDGFDHLKVLNHSTLDSIPFVNRLMQGKTVKGNCDELPF